MFSEENIKRTKEKLAEYVKDNKDSFTRKGDVSINNYWDFTHKELSVKPIEDAMKVLGSTTTIDIITEILNDIHGVSGGASYQVTATEEPTEFTTDGDNYYSGDYDDYDEDNYDDTPLSKLIKEWEDLSDYVKEDIMADIVSANVESEDENEGLILSDVLNIDDVSFKNMDEFKKIIEANVDFEDEDEEVSDKEMVNHPPHYNQGKFETIDIIEDIVAGYDDPVEAYLVGTTLKYLARAPFKNAKKQDLEKAEFYLKRAIDRQQ